MMTPSATERPPAGPALASPLCLTLDAKVDLAQFAGQDDQGPGEVGMTIFYEVERMRRFHWLYGDYHLTVRVSPEGVIRERFDAGVMPFLADHMGFDGIGRFIDLTVADKKVTGRARMSENRRPQEVYKDIKAGIRPGISAGIRPTEISDITTREDKIPHIEIRAFELLEASSVNMPALIDAQAEFSYKGINDLLAQSLGYPKDAESNSAEILTMENQAPYNDTAANFPAAPQDPDPAPVPAGISAEVVAALQEQIAGLSERLTAAPAAPAENPVLEILRLGQEFGDKEGAAAYALTPAPTSAGYLADLTKRRPPADEVPEGAVFAQPKTQDRYDFSAIARHIYAPSNKEYLAAAERELQISDRLANEASRLPGYEFRQGSVFLPWDCLLQLHSGFKESLFLDRPEHQFVVTSTRPAGPTNADEAISERALPILQDFQEQPFLSQMAQMIASGGENIKQPVIVRTGTWKADAVTEGTIVPVVDPEIGGNTMKPDQRGMGMELSQLVIQQSNGQVETALLEAALSEVGWNLDDGLLNSTGDAVGLFAVPTAGNNGLNQIPDDVSGSETNRTAIPRKTLNEMIKEVQIDRLMTPRGLVPGGAYYLSPELAHRGRDTLRDSGEPALGYILTENPDGTLWVGPYPVYVTNHLTATQNAAADQSTYQMFFGNLGLAQVLTWGGIQVIRDPMSKPGNVALSALAWINYNFPRPKGFCIHTVKN